MIAQTMWALGSTRSCIRDLFEYGMQQAAIVGAENVFDFSIGNPSIPAPDAVQSAFAQTVARENSLSVHGYTTAAGDLSAREAIATDLNRRFGSTFSAKNIFMTCGAAPALIATLRALAVEGAEIVVPAPYFAEYRPFVEANGCKFVPVEADTETFQINVEAVEAVITPHTQGVLVNSPNNPSGVVYSRENIAQLAGLLYRKGEEYGHPIYIISDEPYRELLYDGVELPFIPTIYPHTVVCYSFSKSLSLPGERIGYLAVGDDCADGEALLAAAAGAARSIGHVCAPSLQQIVVGLCASVRPDLEAYDNNRKVLYDALTSYGFECVKPSGAFYMLVKAPEGNGAAFSERAKKHNILLVPGTDFGVPGYVRMCTCVGPEMIQRSLPAFQALAQG